MQALLAALAVPASLWCLYLFVLTCASAPVPPPTASHRRLRFDVIVPAHNEESGIGRTVHSLQSIDWPEGGFRVLVVADNCHDATAQVARIQGALVLERHDAERRGKGYALSYAFAHSLAAAWADAVVVVDADAEVSQNLLEAFAARLERGVHAVQVHYGVRNPRASWRTRLMTIAKGAFHVVRSRARERFGLSCGIRGNGWCVTHQLLRTVPYQAFSLAEDLEFGIEVGLAGYRVAYADEASSNAEMVSRDVQAARRQRQRWEHGRFELAASRTRELLRAALRQRSKICLDLALDLLVPPLAYIAWSIVLLAALSAAAEADAPHFTLWLWISAACALTLGIHVLRGWQVSGLGVSGLISFLYAPVFLLWKTGVMLLRPKPQSWIRTRRDS